MAYHVLNRRVIRLPIFDNPGDYEACEQILADGLNRPDALRLLAFCLMPNHWHMVLWPKAASNLSTWMHWLTVMRYVEANALRAALVQRAERWRCRRTGRRWSTGRRRLQNWRPCVTASFGPRP